MSRLRQADRQRRIRGYELNQELCPMCPYLFSTFAQMRRHIVTAHRPHLPMPVPLDGNEIHEPIDMQDNRIDGFAAVADLRHEIESNAFAENYSAMFTQTLLRLKYMVPRVSGLSFSLLAPELVRLGMVISDKLNELGIDADERHRITCNLLAMAGNVKDQEKAMKKLSYFVEPTRHPFPVNQNISYFTVGLKKQVVNLVNSLRNTTFFEQLEQEVHRHRSQSKLISPLDGERCSLLRLKGCIRIVLGCDDFGVGTSRARRKYFSSNFIVENIPLRFNSKRDDVKLALLAPRDGLPVERLRDLVQPMVDELTELIHQGIIVITNEGSRIHVPVVMSAVCADNLGMNDIL